MLADKLVLVLDKDDLVLKVWVLLQTPDLLLRGGKHLGRENRVHTTDDLPVAGDGVFGDELLDEIKGGKLKAGYLRRAIPDTRLTMPSILSTVG